MITEVTPEEISEREKRSVELLIRAWQIMCGASDFRYIDRVKTGETDSRKLYGWNRVLFCLRSLFAEMDRSGFGYFPPERNVIDPIFRCAEFVCAAYAELPPWRRMKLVGKFWTTTEALFAKHPEQCRRVFTEVPHLLYTEAKAAGAIREHEISPSLTLTREARPRAKKETAMFSYSKDKFSGPTAERPRADAPGMRSGITYYDTDEKQAYITMHVDDATKWVLAEKCVVVLKGSPEWEIWGRVLASAGVSAPPAVPSVVLGGAGVTLNLRNTRLFDHAAKLRLARASLLSVDTVARIDACRAIDAALAFVPEHGAGNVGTFRLAPQKISRSMVGDVAANIVALLDYMPRRSWSGLMEAATAWTVAIGRALLEDGRRDQPESPTGSASVRSDWLEREPMLNRETWKRVGK